MRAINTDEALVPAYTLPDVLSDGVGGHITTAAQWLLRRREVLRLFEEHVYGRMPGRLGIGWGQGQMGCQTTLVEQGQALGGTAVRHQIRVVLTCGSTVVPFEILLFTPAGASQPVPTFLGLNFFGNHSIDIDPRIRLSTTWMPENEEQGIRDNRATEKSRGRRQSRWAIKRIVERGYGLATIYCGDFDPDFDDGFANGVHALRPRTDNGDEWGTIGAWAWGLSRALDTLEGVREVDERRVIVFGHSRLGKTALWAGATDPRFAMVISNDSGCGGAALSRRCFGETVAAINDRFPHWFCREFRAYNDREDKLPVDQHMLLALMAPRPVYVASAQEDLWADPLGEFLSTREASPVYELFGAGGLSNVEMPAPGSPVAGTVGYHIRAGGHDVTSYDWECYLDFGDRHLGG